MPPLRIKLSLYLVWLCKVTSSLSSILAPTTTLRCPKQSSGLNSATLSSQPPSKSAWHLSQEGETILEVFERFFRIYLNEASPYNLINSRREWAKGSGFERGREPHKLWQLTNVVSSLLGGFSETNSNPHIFHKWKFMQKSRTSSSH